MCLKYRPLVVRLKHVRVQPHLSGSAIGSLALLNITCKENTLAYFAIPLETKKKLGLSNFFLHNILCGIK
jgi:hypothetical protein